MIRDANSIDLTSSTSTLSERNVLYVLNFWLSKDNLELPSATLSKETR